MVRAQPNFDALAVALVVIACLVSLCVALLRRSPPRVEAAHSFSALTTALIAIVLVTQVAIRSLNKAEPYPAVLFPAGAGMVHRDELGRPALRGHIALYARSPEGDLTPMAVTDVLNEIPGHYVIGITAGEFGQSEAPTIRLEQKRVGRIHLARHVPTAEERAEARLWLAERVHRKVPDASTLVVWYGAIRVDPTTNRIVERELRREYAIELR